jgi:hypothetical protein
MSRLDKDRQLVLTGGDLCRLPEFEPTVMILENENIPELA